MIPKIHLSKHKTTISLLQRSNHLINHLYLANPPIWSNNLRCEMSIWYIWGQSRSKFTLTCTSAFTVSTFNEAFQLSARPFLLCFKLLEFVPKHDFQDVVCFRHLIEEICQCGCNLSSQFLHIRMRNFRLNKA